MFKLKVWNNHPCPLALDRSNLTPRQLNGRELKAAVNAYIRKIHVSASCWRRKINLEWFHSSFQILSKCLLLAEQYLHLEY